MKIKQEVMQLALLVALIAILTAGRAYAFLGTKGNKNASDVKGNQKVEDMTRVEQLRAQHKALLQKRADVLKAVGELEKLIIKLEGQIEEQEWIEEQKK